MIYARIYSSVRTNRKHLIAGPAPCWLWVCGLLYCQEGETDGFIPKEAIDYLGVKNAERLAEHLVRAELWDKVPGGWHVHDYLEHNKSAAQIAERRDQKKAAGSVGGKASGEARRFKQAKHTAEAPREAHGQPIVAVSASGVVAASVVEGGPEGDPPMDLWARELVELYDVRGRCAWNLVEYPLFAVLTADPGVSPWAAWEALKSRLDGHKRSHQWRVKGMVPRLDRWLSTGAHLQELPEHPPSTLISEKTARSMSSAAEFIRGGDRGAH